MSIVVVVGGQFGGEGKGEITAHLCHEYGFDVAVRCGGPNSGHTVTSNDKQVVLRQIPAGVVTPHTKLFLAAGCLIDLNVLLAEIDSFDLTPDRLGIDYKAAIIDKKYVREEEDTGLGVRIGSTCTGTGIAVAKRDTTASGFFSEVGISPLTVSDVIMVIRTFPIRVEGNSGPLPKEIDWETIQRESGYPYKIQEFTTVTKNLRRVARFDLELVKKAVCANMPTHIALMGVDYFNYENKGVRYFSKLTQKEKDFIFWLERELGVKISFVGTGPMDYELIDRLE
ncbi:MAG: adenylosuccinate synthetase [Halobacteriota archaeon]